MKKRTTILTISLGFSVAAFCAAVGCSTTNEDKAKITLKPLAETKSVENLEPYIEDIQFTVLDDERLYLADVCKAVLDRDGNLHVLDFRGNLVSMTPEGEFFKQVTQRGRAGNEYVSASDIALNDSELLILDGQSVKCVDIADPSQYRSIPLPISSPCDALAPIGDGVYVFSAFPAKPADAEKQKDNLLYSVNSDGTLAGQFIGREDCTFSIGNISQSCGNAYYLRPQNSRHIFYKLTEDGPVAEYRVDFQEKNIPERYYWSQAGNDMRTYMMSEYFKLPMDLHETVSHLFFRSAGPGAADYCFVYDRESKKGISWVSGPGDVSMPIMASDDNYFYTVVHWADNYDKSQHGPLYNYIVETAIRSGKYQTGSDIIVRIRFAPCPD